MMITGTVKAVSAKEYKGNPTFAFLLKEDETKWYNVDLTKDSKVNRGDSVSFEVSERGTRVYATGIKATAGSETTPARSNGAYRKPFRSETSGKDDYWKDREARDIVTQGVIQLQSSRNSAIALADILLKNGAVELPKKKNEVLDAVVGLVDELTTKFETQARTKREGGQVGVAEPQEVKQSIEVEGEVEEWS